MCTNYQDGYGAFGWMSGLVIRSENGGYWNMNDIEIEGVRSV